METAPNKLTIHAYQVGFGDCFLLTFHYAEQPKRHILIDFGSTGLPPDTDPNQMLLVAKDIQKRCRGEDGKLSIVVATHRHKDHISGFTTNKKANGVGDIIRSLAPELVIQPWTEDPDLSADAQTTHNQKAITKNIKNHFGQSTQAFAQLLANMNRVAEGIEKEANHLANNKNSRQLLKNENLKQIQFLVEDNALPNKSAVENLQSMGKRKPLYVYYGMKLNLSPILPGVKVRVLGPPRLEDYAAIKKERARDPEEFWMLQEVTNRFWGLLATTGNVVSEMFTGEKKLFPEADYYKDAIPVQVRWVINRMRSARGGQLLEIVRILDKAMNNTSVILLFEVGKRKFLFSGDAQIENWEYALKFAPDHKENLVKLQDIDFYKVGHHGSRNATPKTLWNHLKKRSDKPSAPDRLKTIVSTMGDSQHGYKHGSEENQTEVPRQSLVAELKDKSDYETTQTAAAQNKLFVKMEFDLDL